jgi:hypothetical protein
MKTEIIKMLELPRKIVRGNVPLETCEHAGTAGEHRTARLRNSQSTDGCNT